MKLTKSDILKLFELLNGKLKADGVVGELYLMGGAVMCLAFDARPSTQDVDSVFRPPAVIRKAAAEIADEQGYPANWLNDGVKGYVSDAGRFADYLELSNLRVLVAQPEYLLAMKCLAMRIGEEFHDQADVTFLLRYLNIETFENAKKIITTYYPEARFPQKTFYALQELIDKLK